MTTTQLFPKVRCPHCEKILLADELPRYKVGKNRHDNFIFACPNCHENLKFETAEYFFVTEQLRLGALPEGSGIDGYKESERMPSEQEALLGRAGSFLRRLFGKS